MADTSVSGPPDEEEYYLSQRRVRRDDYHDVARSVTRRVLDVSPRRVSEVRVAGTVTVLEGANDIALETLREAGFTVSDEQLDGKVASSGRVIDAVLSLYAPGLHHAHFLDSDGYGIAARYDDTLQHYWLPAAAYGELRRELDSDVSDALFPIGEFRELMDRE